MVVKAQQIYVSAAMQGMASHTGTRGSATLPPMKKRAMGDRQNICIRYIPKVSLEISEMNFGARVPEAAMPIGAPQAAAPLQEPEKFVLSQRR